MPRPESSSLVRSESPAPEDRWELIRDVLVLQGKLLLDGFRDLALVPSSLIAALAGLLGGGARPGRHFYALLRFARRSEAWINLFGAVDPERSEAAEEGVTNVDAVVGRLEQVVVQQYQRGGVTASAKEAIDRLLDSVHRRPVVEADSRRKGAELQ